MKSRRPKKIFNNLPVWPLLVIGAVIILGSFSYQGFRIYTENLMGKMLMDLVRKETDSLYQISYQKARFNLFSNQLSLTNFSLAFDSTVLNQDSITLDYRTFYKAEIPELSIKADNLWDIYFNHELKVNGLIINHPKIDIYSYPTDDEPATLSFEAGNLYNLISQYLDVFQIQDFDMQEASFNYEKRNKGFVNQYKVDNLSLTLENFVLDSTQVFDSTKVFFTDKIQMHVKDQVIYLPDSIHLLTFESFTISTDPSEISFQNLWLLPRKDVALIQPKNNKLNIYHILIPEFTIKGVDFEEAYHDNALSISDIDLVNPHFTIDKKNFNVALPTNPDSVQTNDLTSLATYFFDRIAVKNFNLDSALFEVAIQLGTRKQNFTVDNVSLAINNFRVDTAMAKYRFDKDFNYFDDIEILVSNYQFNLPDSIHTLKVKNFNLSTSESKLVLDSVTYKAKYTSKDFGRKTQKPNLFDITVPNLTLTGLDINKVLDRQIVEAKTLKMDNPDINLFTYQANQQEKKQVKPDSLYVILTSILNSIEIGDFALEKARFKYETSSQNSNSEVFFSGVNMKSSNLQIDSTTYLETDRLLDADDVYISFTDSYFHLFSAGYLIDAGGGYLSGEASKELYLEDVKFEPIPSSFSSERLNRPLIELSTQSILLKDLNLKNVLSQNNYLLSQVKLTSPEIKLFFRKDKDKTKHPSAFGTAHNAPKNISHLSISLLEMENGKIMIYEDSLLTQSADQMQAFVSDFDITPDKMSSSFLSFLRKSNYNFSGKNYNWIMADSVHQLHIGNFRTSSIESLILLEDLSIKPVKPVADYANVYRINAPVVEIKDHNAQKFSQETGINIRRLTAKNPTLEITLGYDTLQTVDTTEAFMLDKLPNTIHLWMPWLSIKNFDIENANIKLTQKKPASQNQFFANNASIHIDRFYVDSLTQLNYKNFFFTNSIDLQIRQYAHSLAFGKDSISIENLSFSSGDSLLVGQHIYTHHLDNNQRKNFQFKVSIPDFSIKGIDVYQAYRNKNYNLGDVTFTNPDIAIQTKLTGGSKSKLNNQIVLPENVFHSLGMRSLKLENGQVNFTVSKNNQTTPYQLTNTSIFAQNIQLDSVNDMSADNLFFSDKFQLKTEDISIDLPDSLNTLKIDQVGFSTEDSTLLAENFQIIPKLKKEEVAPHYGYQKGWLNLQADTLSLAGLHLYDLLYKSKLDARQLDLCSLQIRSFKDRSFPFPEDYNPPTFHQFLKQTNQYINIDSIIVRNGNINVELKVENYEKPGRLFFTDFNVNGSHITNDSFLISQGILTRLDAKAYLMGTGLLQTHFKFDLQDKSGRYWFDASLAKMDMRDFNRILAPIASMRIKSGEVEKVDMAVEANDKYAVGNMNFYYKGLYVSILNEDDNSKQGFTSFLANTFFINSSNPTLFKFKKGTIYSERDQRKLIFDQWFKSCLSGIISSVGIGNNKKEIRKAGENEEKEESPEDLKVHKKPEQENKD